MRRTLKTALTQRWMRFVLLTIVLSIVSDGWSGKPSPLVHQLLLLPFAAAFTALSALLLFGPSFSNAALDASLHQLPAWWSWTLACLQAFSVLLMWAEERHFAALGYRTEWRVDATASLTAFTGWLFWTRRRSGVLLLGAELVTYAAGIAVALRDFPLNYLRSDMLPVILWADTRLAKGLNPYVTMQVADRLYDFPYLPGMLVAFWPAVALHFDLRLLTLVCVCISAVIVFRLARCARRREVAATLGVFLLCPFLQYRHDLYLAPHWLSVCTAVALMQKRRFGWSAVVWGVSSAVYQLSWVIVPFFILNAYRRRGLAEAVKMAGLVIVGVTVIAGPFLPYAWHQVAANTVGQWSLLPHALADPINLSYWITYFVRPDHLRWVQAVVMTAIFLYCAVRGRCSSVTDTLRWMTCGLGLFIPLNVLVDGYFYLTFLLVMMLYVCSVNDWWAEPPATDVSVFVGAGSMLV